MRKKQSCFGTWKIDNKKKLAIFSGRSSKAFKQVDFVSLKSDTGWYIDAQGNVNSWAVEGLSQREEELLFYGPDMDIEALEENFCPTKEEFLLIRNLFCQMETNHTQRFSLLHLTRIKSGGFFLLPSRILEAIIHSSESRLEDLILPYHHPYFRGREALSYGLALLQFQLLTGDLPWHSEDQEAMEFEIRSHRLPAFGDYLQGRTAPLLDQCLKGGRQIPDLKEWEEVDPLVKEDCTEEIRGALERSEKIFRRVRFRHQNRIAIVLVSAAVLVVGIMGGFFIKSLTEPAYTQGLDPREVIEGYYTEYNDLDSPGTASYCRGPGKRPHQRELDYLHVAIRVSLGNMHEELTVSPQRWEEMGRGELHPEMICFGISGLEIEALDDDSYRVEYIKWEVPETEELTAYQPVLFHITEEIDLNYRKKSWFIGDIRPLNRVLMENPGLENIQTSLLR